MERCNDDTKCGVTLSLLAAFRREPQLLTAVRAVEYGAGAVVEYVAREDVAAPTARAFKEAACKDVLEKNQADRKIEKQQQVFPGAEWYKQDQYGFQHLNRA